MEEDLQVRAVLGADATEFVNAFDQAATAAKQFQAAVTPSTKTLTALGVAVGAAGFAMFKFGKEAFGVAARVSELSVAIDAVGKATGIGSYRINQAAKAIRDNGIEMDAAQKIALTYAQNNLDLASASKVARVAQDLAVISQRNSTDTAELLTRAIQTGSSILLKSAGISKYASEGYAAYAKQIGKTTNSLTAAERQQAMINLVLSEGTKVAGLYEAAMTEPGKVLRSFARLQNDMRMEMGNALLQGFGPVIKAVYDLTNAFSKTLREGGFLHPIIKEIGDALVRMFQPVTDGLGKLTQFVKGLKGAEFNAKGLADSFNRLAPVIGAVATGLATLGGRGLLNLIPGLGGVAKFLNPVTAGLTALVILSPKLRDAFTGLAAAMAPMIPPLLELAKAAAEVATQMVEVFASLAGGLAGAVLVPVVTALAAAMKALAANAMLLKPILFAIAGLMVAKFVKGFWMAGAGAGALSQRFKLLRVSMANASASFKAQIADLQRYYASASQGGVAIGKFGAAVRVGAAVAKSAILSLMSTLAPMLALYAAFEIYNYWRKEQERVKEVTDSVTQAFKEQMYALKGDKNAIAEFITQSGELETILGNTGETGKELVTGLGAVGATVEQVSAAFADKNSAKIREFNDLMAKQNGIVFESANQRRNFYRVVENTGGWASRDASALKQLTPEQQAFAISLRDVNRAGKSLDLGGILTEQMDYAAGLSSTAKKARDYAIAQAEANGSVEGAIDTVDEARTVYEAFAKKNTELTAAETKQKEETVKLVKELTPLVTLINNLNKANEDGKVSAEAFSKSFEGQYNQALDARAAIDAMRQGASSLAKEVKGTKGSTDSFTSAGFKLREMIASNAAQLLSLGGNSQDVANMMNSLIAQFRKAAGEANFSDQEVTDLLKSLMLLDKNGNVRLDIKVQTDEARAQLASVLTGFVTLMKAGKQVGAFKNIVEAEIKDLEAQSKGLRTGADSFDDYTSAADRAGQESKKVAREKERLKEAIMKIANEALEKATARFEEYKQALEGIKNAAKSAIYGSYSLGDALSAATEAADEANKKIQDMNDEFAEYKKGVMDAISGSLSLGDALSAQQQAAEDIAEANKDVDEAQAKVNEQQALYNQLLEAAGGTQGRKARREAYEKAADQAEKLADAQRDLADATKTANAEQAKQQSFIDRLREQAKLATRFADQLVELTNRGLSQDAIDQIVAAGAEAGSEMAKELIDGGSEAIDETNTLFKEIARVSDKAGQRMADHYKELGTMVGADFVAALASQAHKVSQFSEQVKRLVSMGLSPQNIQLVLEAGYRAGTEIANAIEEGGADAIAQLNEMEASLRAQGEALGKMLGDTFYQAGYDTAKSVVEGMKERIKTLQQEIEDATIPQLQAILARIKGEFDKLALALPAPAATVVNTKKTDTTDTTKTDTTMTDKQRAEAELAAMAKGAVISFANPNIGVTGAVEMAAAARGAVSYDQAVELIRRRTGLATGGIVTRPIISEIGEAGPEAVIPLNRLNAMTSGGGTTVINLTVNAGMGADGKTIGDAIVNELKRWSRRNGKIPVTTQ